MESSCVSPAPDDAAAAAAAVAAAPLAPDLRREHMFDKVVTPSDVGKLNRLVIPKQHAERFFPLDPALAVKGLTLAFEDAGGGGQRWCFRYSYWSSSQSYVITKGWSRFVREKQLSAGDTVSFSRSSPAAAAGDHHCRRLFIDSQRRGRPRPKSQRLYSPPSLSRFSITGPAWRSLQQMDGMQFESRRDAVGMRPVVAVPAVVLDGAAKPKQLRLFGVNLECPEPEGGGHSRLSLLAGGGEQWS